jgi:hypothetical protein
MRPQLAGGVARAESAATCCITPCWLELLPLGEMPLALGPQASRPHSPVWRALPADWQEHPVLRHTARELGRMGGPQQLEG